MAKVKCGWQCTVYITQSARPIICGGVRAEGPTVSDMQRVGEEGADGAPAPEIGGGPQKEAGVIDM
eukprot:1002980-Amphidinium_carterae.1